MNKRELAARFEKAAVQARKLGKQLKPLDAHLLLACDRWALNGVLGDLMWMDENLTIIARHLKNLSLDDGMGYWFPPGKGPKHRRLAKGTSMVQAHKKELGAVRGGRRS